MTIFTANTLAAATLAVAAASTTILTSTPKATAAETVNIYSYRQPQLIEPVLKDFTEATGIETKVLFLDKGLEERIAAEGQGSPADLILTTDISRLTIAKELGVTQPISNKTVNSNIPAEYRDPEGHWYGLTRRGRVVYASVDRVKTNEISYEQLADPEWKGRICIRSGQHSYNLGLFGSLIAHWGEEKTENWMTGLKANLARKPNGNDRAQAKGVFSGECDLAIGNTYYVGLMQTNEKEPEQKDWARSIKVIFPDIDGKGTHVNISGAALAKYAPNRDNAVKLLEFLSSNSAQQVYAESVFEYPANPNVEPSERVKSWGAINADTLPLSEIAKNRKAASEMVDRVGLNDGAGS